MHPEKQPSKTMQNPPPSDPILASFLHNFSLLASVPRPSKHERAVSNLLKAWAETHGFHPRQNAAWDLVFDVPATPGLETLPLLALQAHLDMVCVARDGRPYDPLRDPIHPILDRAAGTLKADGTTLGADDGAGVALIMSIAEGQMPHGPLRVLFTADEETSMTGARALTPDDLRDVKYLINIDSEESDAVTVSSAADCELHATASLQPAAPSKNLAQELSLTDLSGGHSGLEIASGKCNAIIALAETLQQIAAELPIELSTFTGGTAKNAIPAKARAIILLAPSDLPKLQSILTTRTAQLKTSHSHTDPNLTLQITPVSLPQAVLPPDATTRLLHYVTASLNGVHTMSPSIADLVESSSNLGLLEASPSHISCIQMARSSSPAKLREIETRQTALAQETSLSLKILPGSRAWPVNPHSTLLPRLQQIYRTLTSKELRVVALHAGLECGLFADLSPSLDLLSIGPDITSAHSPDETLHLSSIPLIWSILEQLLANLD